VVAGKSYEHSLRVASGDCTSPAFAEGCDAAVPWAAAAACQPELPDDPRRRLPTDALGFATPARTE